MTAGKPIAIPAHVEAPVPCGAYRVSRQIECAHLTERVVLRKPCLGQVRACVIPIRRDTLQSAPPLS
jgi:hypothetical protein